MSCEIQTKPVPAESKKPLRSTGMKITGYLKELFKFDGPTVAIIFKDLLVALTICVVISQFGRLIFLTDLTTHFRVQYALGSIIIGAVFVYFKHWKKAALCLVLLGVSVANIATSPLPVALEQRAAGAPQFKITQYNKLKSNDRYDEIEAALRNNASDLVVLQEATPRAEALSTALKDVFPHQIIATENHAFGMIIMSKHPFNNKEYHVVRGIKLNNIVLQASIRPDGFAKDIIVYALHAVPPMTQEYWLQRNLELTEVADFVLKKNSPHTILIGDWNVSPYSPFFSKLLKKTNLSYTSNYFLAQPTWPAAFDFSYGLFQIPIDHILFGHGLAPYSIEIAPALGSDHRMVSMVLGETTE